MIKHYEESNKTEADVRRIADLFKTSVTTANKIFSQWRSTQTIRKPHQGQGKRSDPRWVFAGPGAATNLLQLERAFGEGECDDFAADIRTRYLESGGAGSPSERTVATALRDRLAFTSKGISKRARERNAARCEAWIARVNQKYTANQIVCIDETCVGASAPHSLKRVAVRPAPHHDAVGHQCCAQACRQSYRQPPPRACPTWEARARRRLLQPWHALLIVWGLQSARDDWRTRHRGEL